MKQRVKELSSKARQSQLYYRLVLPKHYASALKTNIAHRFPAKGLQVIGVTGTDGKTTTATLIGAMLRRAGKKVAVITTVAVDYGDGKGAQPTPGHMTTASANQLATMLDAVKASGAEWLVLETSSHALSQHRVMGVPFSIAVITNITHEHLDYHGTFKRYVAAKRRLFTLTKRNKKGLQLGVVNADDPSAQAFISASKHVVTYGLEKGDVRAEQIKLSNRDSSFRAVVDGEVYEIQVRLPGRFNVYNTLAAISVGRAVGLNKAQIEQGIASLTHVEGRMNRLNTNKPFEVIVDYAVTPAALESVLSAAQETATGKVRIVFGATGDRDKEKRPVMGRIAAERADFIYLTDDETHTEDPAQIRDAVLDGVKKAGGAGKCLVFDDRGDAIKAALNDAQPGDVVLITGLGHQTTRNMGGRDEPWSDAEFALKQLG